ncbi:AbrB family transcriptional regulator [Microvirga pudoricolor]|uniref:AbrB family transcriptional regulator n=1 Tax=Microvirga pudoricolor TaxID=2778729 RepID=UPI00194DDF2F|nr:AbrB family transcriptional regulator [Microvirga pudoricolor]MBM6596748.1 AbrB family transcriptional regulator [Microvirga pudoricolor]
MPLVTTIPAHLIKLAVAALGGLAFFWLGVPGGWLSGAAIATILWGLTRLSPTMPRHLADLAMLTSGATMGAAVTPEAIAAMGRYPLSLLVLVIGVAGISMASSLWLVFVSRWRRDDAVLASVPGALSTVMAVAIDRNASVAPIAIVQNLRLIVLIALLPSVVVLTGGGTVSGTLLGQGRATLTPGDMALVLGGGYAVGLVLARLGMAAPILLGATLVSTLGHATGWMTGVMPPILATAGLILIGVFIGDRFRGLDYATLPRTILAGLGSFTMGMGAAVAFAGVAAWVAEVSFANALVAFAPGGLEAMTILALILGLDPIYVGIHHFVRFIGIGVTVPFIVAWLQRNDPPKSESV